MSPTAVTGAPRRTLVAISQSAARDAPPPASTPPATFRTRICLRIGAGGCKPTPAGPSGNMPSCSAISLPGSSQWWAPFGSRKATKCRGDPTEEAETYGHILAETFGIRESEVEKIWSRIGPRRSTTGRRWTRWSLHDLPRTLANGPDPSAVARGWRKPPGAGPSAFAELLLRYSSSKCLGRLTLFHLHR